MFPPRLMIAIVVLLLVSIWPVQYFAASLQAARIEYDRNSLISMLGNDLIDNDPVADALLIRAEAGSQNLVSPEWLGLRRDRLAYVGKQGDEVVLIAVPFTVDDGFNDSLDLLVAFDMRGEIVAARVVAEPLQPGLMGGLTFLESRWMREFSGMASRDLKRPSWQGIAADDGVDQFVGASITPKAVAAGMYDALLFFQSNRMMLVQGDPSLRPDHSPE
ncbi:FMN-binding protein [Gammaproteobacteria bacterium LSUCC0112]|nr:FMN-binding protein [Gammaproteobacteria bacterium LSUCC0112]